MRALLQRPLARLGLGVFSLLSLATTVWGIPAFLESSVGSLGGEALYRSLAALVALILGGLAIGPDRLESSAKRVSGWFYADRGRIESLEADIERLKAEGAPRDYKLNAYESRDTGRMVFELLPARDYAFWPINKRNAEGYTELRVPYDGAYNGLPGSRTTFSVGTLGGEYSVTLGHMAYHDPRDSSHPVEPYDIETHLLVWECSNREESLVRRMAVSSEWGLRTSVGVSRWAYAVSATARLPGLPEGEYAFEVRDRTNAPGKGIIFRDMYLAIYKLGEG